MIFGKLFYVIVIDLSFDGLWKIFGPTPTSDGNPDIRKRYKTTDKFGAPSNFLMFILSLDDFNGWPLLVDCYSLVIHNFT